MMRGMSGFLSGLVAPHLSPHEGYVRLRRRPQMSRSARSFSEDCMAGVVVALAAELLFEAFRPIPAVRGQHPIQSPWGAIQSASERFSSPRVWLRSIGKPLFASLGVGNDDRPFSARAGRFPTPCRVKSGRWSRIRQQALGVVRRACGPRPLFRGGRGSPDNAP